MEGGDVGEEEGGEDVEGEEDSEDSGGEEGASSDQAHLQRRTHEPEILFPFSRGTYHEGA